MFLDGVTYAAISRNLAAGQGSFWVPHYTETLYPQFFEHPPLVFGIQSLFFSLFGDSMAVERLYSGLMAVISMMLIISLWRLFSETEEQRSFAWLPVLLWIVTPVVFWSYRNNMIENTLTVMVLGSAWFIGKSMLTARAVWLLPASLFILGAFLSKGPVGLFPLVMPLGYSLITKRMSNLKAVWFIAVLLLLPVLLFLVICLIQPQAWDSIQNYLTAQVFPSITGGREITATSRFEIVLNLVGQLAAPISLLIFLGLISRRFGNREAAFPRRTGWFMIAIGLAGSLPLMATLKQHEYYLVPSIPFFAIGLAMILPAYEKLRFPVPAKILKYLRWSGFAGLAGVLVLSAVLAGKPYRDKELLQDVKAISGVIVNHHVITVNETRMANWILIAYLSRTADISLDSKRLHPYYLAGKREELPDSIVAAYNPLPLEMVYFKLLKQRE